MLFVGRSACNSIVLRRLAGMEMEEYIRRKLAARIQFGGWGYAMQQANGKRLEHTPGGGGIALRATDALRFAYMLLRNGYWGDKQVAPADYLALCRRPSPFNPHSPFSLQFEVNEDRHVAGARRSVFQIGRRRLLHLCRSIARPGRLQNGVHRFGGPRALRPRLFGQNRKRRLVSRRLEAASVRPVS